MPKLKHESTGVVVSVSDATAALLGAEWKAADVSEKRSPGRPKKSEE